MMGPEPFQDYVGHGSISPEEDQMLSGWQTGMRTLRDRESDAGRRSFRRAARRKKHNGEKTESPGSQSRAMALGAHDEDCIPRFASSPVPPPDQGEVRQSAGKSPGRKR